MLHEHRVLTTHAIAHMAFTSDHRARRRLLQLHSWDVLERFAPRLPVGQPPCTTSWGRPGPPCWPPITAYRSPRCGTGRDDALAIAHHHTLAHTVAVNDLFAHLVHHTLPPQCPVSGWTAGGPRPAAVASWTTSGRGAFNDTASPPAPAPRPEAPIIRRRNRSQPAGALSEWFLELDFATLLDITGRPNSTATPASPPPPDPAPC